MADHIHEFVADECQCGARIMPPPPPPPPQCDILYCKIYASKDGLCWPHWREAKLKTDIAALVGQKIKQIEFSGRNVRINDQRFYCDIDDSYGGEYEVDWQAI